MYIQTGDMGGVIVSKKMEQKFKTKKQYNNRDTQKDMIDSESFKIKENIKYFLRCFTGK
ncbi:MAG: hypothetical protein ACI86M_003304 [Saprospiraceae bacterium]|jgi:hypothetical protein